MSDVSKIKRLPGTDVAPETILAEAMESVENIQSVLVAMHKKDGSVDVQWSSMRIDALCFIEREIKNEIDKVFAITKQQY